MVILLDGRQLDLCYKKTIFTGKIKCHSKQKEKCNLSIS